MSTLPATNSAQPTDLHATVREPDARALGSGLALALALLFAPAAARGLVALDAQPATLPAPFVNGITANPTSSDLTVTVTNTGDQVIRSLSFAMPSGYVARGGTPPGSAWTPSYTTSAVRFAAACASAGIVPGDSATFVISLTAPRITISKDVLSSAFTVTGSTDGVAGPCGTTATGVDTFQAWIKVLRVVGTLTRTAPNAASVAWRVTNQATSGTLSALSVVSVVTPSAGVTVKCGTLSNLRWQKSNTITCTYTFSSYGTYQLDANVQDGARTAGGVGATVGTFTYGPSAVFWDNPVAVKGLSTNTLSLLVANGSGVNITGVDVTNASSTGWTLSTATANTGLSYNSAGSSAANVKFGGTLKPGFSSDLTITFSAVPSVASTTPYTFGVTLTFSSGSPVSTTQTVVVVVPVPDVALLTIQADANGNVLDWSNVSGNGSTHAGVVVFRAPAGTAPAFPDQFAEYTAGSDGVVYTSQDDGTNPETFTDDPGNFDYRVCSYDQYLVYSSCSTGFPSAQGWLSSGAVVGTGWVTALGGDTRVRAAFVPGGRVAQGSLAPYVAILDVATGQASFAPTPIPGLPTTYTPVIPLANGKTVLFAADMSGNLTAIDASNGSVYWGPVNFPGENFTAGVAGITRSYASAAYKAAYSMDMLLLGSASGTGNVYAIDTSNGNVLWSFAAGASVTGLVNYDAATDLFYVPTRGAGVKAYTIAGSRPGVPAPAAPSWVNTDPTGNYAFHCVRFLTSVACLNTSGVLRVMDKTTGALKTAATYTTLITNGPNAPVLDSASATMPGLVISSAADGVQVLTVNTTTTPYTITSRGRWTPPSGVRISSPAVYQDAARRYLVVGGGNGTTDGQRLYRLSLDTVAQLARSPQVSAMATPLTVTQPTYDSTTGRYLFGTSDGHVWAIPASTGWVTP